MNPFPLRQMVYDKILNYILDGKIGSGEKLGEIQLAKELGVSRTPVREAFLQLEKKGWLDLHSNSGAVVKKITASQIEEMFNMISVLEGYAVEMTTQGIRTGDISYLNDLCSRIEKLGAARDYLRYAEKDSEFHNFFVTKTGNRTLQETVQDMRRKVHTSGLTLPFHMDQYLIMHKKIVGAIAKKNPQRAGNLMRVHVQEVKGFVLEKLHQFRGNGKFAL